MASSTIDPRVLGLLARDGGLIKIAKDETNPFQSFAGPPGRYYARLIRLDVTSDKKTQNPKFTWVYGVLAGIPDVSSAGFEQFSRTYAGYKAQTTLSTNETEKMSRADAYARAMQAFGCHGIDQTKFGMRNGMFDTNALVQDIGAAIMKLNAEKPAVLIEVTETQGTGKNAGKVFKNVNARELIAEEVVKQFGSIDIVVSDQEVQAMAEASEPEAAENGMSETDAKTILEATSTEELRSGLVSSAEINGHYGDGFLAAADREFLLAVALAAMTHTPLPPVPATPVVTTTTTTVAGNNEEEEEEEEEADSSASMKYQMHIGTMTRDQLKSEVRRIGSRPADVKFKTSETDEALRNELMAHFTANPAPF